MNYLTTNKVNAPVVTIAVPSLNQGPFLNNALESIFNQDLPVEVYVMDGGSTDCSVGIIRNWESRLSGWRSGPDLGQAAAINEGVALGSAPYVCWLNSDDRFLPGALQKLCKELERAPLVPGVYGKAWNEFYPSGKLASVWVESFSAASLARRCIISQPASLIRRSAWDRVSGLNEKLHMAMDYDLWWRIFKQVGPLSFVNEYIAVNSIHISTKTNTLRRLHYQEAMAIVRTHYGSIPLKWWLYMPYSIWYKSFANKLKLLWH
jgi:GT2 family glycosyltransferase